jgi:CO/xanthine dehydrogenase Mo-binding subunit
MDFLMPTAMEVPEVAIGHEETPSPLTVHGIKGGGEAGRMMAPSAISAAIDDALSGYGVHVTELPATPERIVGWIAGGAMPGPGPDLARAWPRPAANDATTGGERV